jgi:hypothetical protein
MRTLTHLLVLCLFATASLAQREVDLRPKFEKGETVRYRLEMEADTSLSGGALPTGGDAKMQITYDLSLTATEVEPEKGATLALVYDRVRMKIDSDMILIDFDSTKPADPNDPMSAALAQMVGTTLTMKMDANGNITSVTGGGMLSPLTSSAGGKSPQDAIGSIVSIKKGGGVVKVGESWTNEDTTADSILGGFRMITTHKVKRVSGGKAYVSVDGKMTPLSEGPGSTVTVRKANYDGEYVWDAESGKLHSMQIDQSAEIAATVGESDVTQTSSSRVRITKLR